MLGSRPRLQYGVADGLTLLVPLPIFLHQTLVLMTISAVARHVGLGSHCAPLNNLFETGLA